MLRKIYINDKRFMVPYYKYENVLFSCFVCIMPQIFIHNLPLINIYAKRMKGKSKNHKMSYDFCFI